MRILSNRSNWIICLVMAVFGVTFGDVSQSQGKKGTAASLSVRESFAHNVKATMAKHERVSAYGANQTSAQNAPQWRQTSGPEGGVVVGLFRHGSTLFAGMRDGGVFRSTDQGMTWMAASNGLPPLASAFSFAAVGTELYVGIFGGIYRSSDDGMSWKGSYTGLGTFIPQVHSLAVAGTDIFAVSERGVLRSTDQRGDWTSVNTGLPSFPGSGFLAVIGTNVFVGEGSRVFRTTDRGESWMPVTEGLPAKTVLALIANGTTLFVGTRAGVYRSTNLGESWTETNTGLTDPSVFALTTAG